MKKVVLLRHGLSEWNKMHKFTGWTDVPLTEEGEEQAREAGRILKKHNFKFDIAYTSVQNRAIKTLWLALEEIDQIWIPVVKNWRLNERHYGALQGLNKDKAYDHFGKELVEKWRRGYAERPPSLTYDDPRYPEHEDKYKVNIEFENIPTSESLQDTLNRTLPYWNGVISPRIEAGSKVIVSAHGNSLRAIIKHLSNISDEEIPSLEIDYAKPIVYEFEDNMKVLRRYYLK